MAHTCPKGAGAVAALEGVSGISSRELLGSGWFLGGELDAWVTSARLATDGGERS